MSNDLRRKRKDQHHSPEYNSWNYRGHDDFSSFDPNHILAGDNWDCSASEMVMIDDLAVFPGDLVVALQDNPGPLNYTNLMAGQWHIIRKKIGNYGPKYSAVDGGELFDMSVDDDYLYICVQSGTPGNAVWKRTSILTI